MRPTPEYLAGMIRLRWVVMGLGAAAFVGFGLTGGMLADAASLEP